MRLRLTTRRARLAAFFLLYLSEGIPFGFTAVTMTAYLRRHGVGLEAIGLFSATLYAPWGFKWAWAPLIDLVRFERFGTSRAWIVLAQTLMIVSLGVVLFFDPARQLALVTGLIIVHNVFAATQDIAIDALAVRVIPEKELGTANGLMFAAAYVGQAIGGSGALYVAGKLGYTAAFAFMLGALTVLLLAVSLPLLEPPIAAAASLSSTPGARAVEPGDAVARIPGAGIEPPVGGVVGASQVRVGREALDRVRSFLADLSRGFFRSGRGPLLGVLFALLPQGAVALGLALATTIPVDLGMSEEQIAGLSLMGAIAAALGSVAGGWVSDRFGHRRSLGVWYALTAVPTLFLAARFAGAPGVAGVTAGLYTVVNVCYSFTSGLQYGTGNALFMALSSRSVAATQFTGYMALKNLALSYSNLWQGKLASLRGYSLPLFIDGLGAALPILLLPFVRPRARGGEEGAPVGGSAAGR
jgi:PAT family beta-lactamase induction signal transducer AmpG